MIYPKSIFATCCRIESDIVSLSGYVAVPFSEYSNSGGNRIEIYDKSLSDNVIVSERTITIRYWKRVLRSSFMEI
jgi:hypothetical protein